MTNKSRDVFQMFRQALAAQMEMGLHELIVPKISSVETELKAQTDIIAGQIIQNQEVTMTAKKENRISQSAMALFQEPSYNSLEEHYQAICNCQLCPLGATRINFVYGVGDPQADLMFIGEAPGAEEDRQGKPFVGRAGQLLDRILASVMLKREEVYICNILKCRPPGNRDPQPDEMARCFPHLREQVRLIKPKLICALGRVAAQALLQTSTPLSKLRNHWHEFEGVPLWITYHPAALLRFPSYKRDTWEDMKILKARYEALK